MATCLNATCINEYELRWLCGWIKDLFELIEDAPTGESPENNGFGDQTNNPVHNKRLDVKLQYWIPTRQVRETW